jgi:predicted amidophosphoribosyltransferase
MANEPVEGRCGECWAFLDEDDEFCPECGTKRGEGDFNPEDNFPEVVYGPPDVFSDPF